MNKNYLEILKSRKGFAEADIIYGLTNKPYNYKPSSSVPKVSVFIGDLVGLTLTDDNKTEMYIMSYNDSAYVFEKELNINSSNISVEELMKQAIIRYNVICNRSEQVVDERYVKKGLFSLKYL